MAIAPPAWLTPLSDTKTRQAVLVALLTITTSLTLRAEAFLVAIAVLTAAVAAALPRSALWRRWDSIDKPLLASTMALAVLWAYGILRGLAGGHPPGHVLRNFFGLAVFLPALLSVALMVDRAGIARIVVRTGTSTLGLLLVLRTASVLNVLPLEIYQRLGVPVGLSEFGFRLYSFGAFPIFGWQALVAMAMYRALDRREWRRAAARGALLLVIVVGTAFVTESKGILLGTLAVLGIPLLLERRWATSARYAVAAAAVVAVHLQVVAPAGQFAATEVFGLKRSEEMLTVVEKARLSAEESGGAAGSSLVSRSDTGTNPLDLIFGAQRLGNVERYAQARELLGDVILAGHGLGAPITSGYNRSVTFPYGFELSFLNVIHKFGVFSVVYFAFLAYCAYRILMSPKPAFERAAVLGLLGYIFPAVGNPVLFAVQAVYLHMLAMHGVTRRRAEESLVSGPPLPDRTTGQRG